MLNQRRRYLLGDPIGYKEHQELKDADHKKKIKNKRRKCFVKMLLIQNIKTNRLMWYGLEKHISATI